MRRSRTPRRVAAGRSRNAGHKLAPSILLAVSCLMLAPYASAQSGGTGVDPVDGVVATVEYEVEQALNTTNPPPGNGTNPPGNGTTPPGNGTTPPGNGTTPPGNGTNPPGNGTTPGNQTTSPPGNQTTTPGGNQTTTPDGNHTAGPDDNSTAPDDNSTTPADGNETADPGTNSTVTAAGNSTADANATVSASVGDSAGGGDTPAEDEACVACTGEDGTETNSTVGDVGSSGDGSEGSGGSGGKNPCVACDRSRPVVSSPKPGFPMTPLLITLILGPLAGLAVAHYAIRRWNVAKPAKPGATLQAGPKGPSDAFDPMRKFLLDVKEWKAMPQPSAAPPDPAPGSV